MPATPNSSAKRVSAADAEGLVRACREGSQAAWDEMVARYGRLVYSIPRRYGLTDADADDEKPHVLRERHDLPPRRRRRPVLSLVTTSVPLGSSRRRSTNPPSSASSSSSLKLR